ncbi:MAG: patatin-like phospholipase family protein [Clostridiales bacterium]|nr:patatin-like phospholipase family protein [Clostridiales bacterium]
MGFFGFLSRNERKQKSRKPKIALCLGGGGARGFAHLGALKVFDEEVFDFDMCVGTSVGSLVGAFYCAGLEVEQMISYSREIDIKDVRTGRLFFPSDPMAIGDLFTRRMGNMNIEDMVKPFYCVAVDIVSGKEVIFDKGSAKQAISSSCAVPLVFRPVVIGDKHLVDGGLLNNIPASVCKMFGADFVVTVDVNPTRGEGTKELGTLDVIKATFSIMSAHTSVEGLRLSDVIIAPNLSEFSAARKDGYEKMIELGYNAAKEKVEDIKKLFDTITF